MIVFRFPRLVIFLAAAVLFTACAGPGRSAPLDTPLASDTPTATLTATSTIVWFPVTETSTPRPSQIVAPTEDPRPPLGEVLLSDPLIGEDGNPWGTSRTEAGSAAFGVGELTLAVQSEKGLVSILRSQPELKDYYLQVDVEPSLCRGEDSYGLLARAQSEIDTYRFAVSCSGQFRVERVRRGQILPLTEWAQSEVFLASAPDTLRLGLLAAEDGFRFYINDTQQLALRDPIYGSGRIGFFARSANPDALTVNFTNLMVFSVDPLAVRPTLTPTPTPRPSHTRLPSPTAGG